MLLQLKPGKSRKQRHMVRRLAILCGFLLVAFSLVAPAPMAFAQGKSSENQKDQKWNKRREERLKDYKDETGKVRPKKWKEGVEHYKQMEFTAGVSRFSSGNEGSSLAPAGAAGAGAAAAGAAATTGAPPLRSKKIASTSPTA